MDRRLASIRTLVKDLLNDPDPISYERAMQALNTISSICDEKLHL